MTSARDALRDAVPIVIGYVTLGLAAGMLLVAEGLSWWWAPLWSLVIYSGTMQMLLVPLAGAGEPLAAIAASTAFPLGSTPSTRSPTKSTRCSPPRTAAG